MFKRYKNPFEKELSNPLFEKESPPQQHPSSNRSTPYSTESVNYGAKEVPPRVFDESQVQTPRHSFHSNFEPQTEKNEPLTPEAPNTTPPQRKIPTPSIANSLLMNDDPDTTIGEGVTFKGELTFDKLLRIDGHFEGDLLSEGKLIIGPRGVVKSNVQMREAVIEGILEGNITVTDRIELRDSATVMGNIKARYISVDEGVTIIGHVSVKPEDPQQEDKREEEYAHQS